MAVAAAHLGEAAERWSLPGPDWITWRSWGDEFVVYNGARASTHLLSSLAGAVLEVMHEPPVPRTVDDLVLQLAESFELPLEGGAAASLRASVADALIEFERLGLATRTTS